MLPITRLEQYTLKRPQEVLLVNATVDGEEDAIMIFRGFSSSLMRPTATDPDVPILPATATILTIDRLQGPYNPAQPKVIEADLTWAKMAPLMEQAGV